MTTLTEQSKLTRSQKKTYGPRFIAGWGKDAQITAKIRFDDECGNGHNTFSITAEISIPRHHDVEACGCLHDEIARVFPQLAPYIKWHLVSTDEPMHYIANTLYWLGYDTRWCTGKTGDPPNFEHAKSTAVWADMPEELLASSGKHTRESVTALLRERMPNMLAEFRQAVEELGFTW